MIVSEAELAGCVISDVRREIAANADIALRAKAQEVFADLQKLPVLAAVAFDGHQVEYIVGRIHAAFIEVHQEAQD